MLNMEVMLGKIILVLKCVGCKWKLISFLIRLNDDLGLLAAFVVASCL